MDPQIGAGAGSPPAISPRLGLPHATLEAAIHGVDQQPRAAVRHAERLGRRSDRSAARYGLQKLDLSRPDGDVGAAADAQTKLDLGLHSKLTGAPACGWRPTVYSTVTDFARLRGLSTSVFGRSPRGEAHSAHRV